MIGKRMRTIRLMALIGAVAWLALLPVDAGADSPQEGDIPPPDEPALCQTDVPICCGETCGPRRPCCDGTICSDTLRCVPEVCRTCGGRGCEVNFLECTGRCQPPACCGETCSAYRPCCSGTICNLGRCVPEACNECGQQGCAVNYLTCTAECATPQCCLQSCTTSAQCCLGTVCRQTASGERQCVPRACEECGGMTPTCSVDDQCRVSCAPPPTCGDQCQTSAQCGGGLVCRQFSSVRRCVPAQFDDECRRCGAAGCGFNSATCEVVCADR